MRLRLEFSIYGEAVFISIQNFVIIYLIWHYNKSIGLTEKVVFFSFTAVYTYAVIDGTLVTSQMWDFIVSSSLLLQFFTKVPQIWTTFVNKSTGQLAFVTFFLTFAGTIARTATVLFESDDFMYRLQFLLSLFFNTVIIIQFFIYWNAEQPKKRGKVTGPGA